MRILNALDVKPRRTIRIALWTGEEQGFLVRKGYAKQHFGMLPALDRSGPDGTARIHAQARRARSS